MRGQLALGWIVPLQNLYAHGSWRAIHLSEEHLVMKHHKRYLEKNVTGEKWWMYTNKCKEESHGDKDIEIYPSIYCSYFSTLIVSVERQLVAPFRLTQFLLVGGGAADTSCVLLITVVRIHVGLWACLPSGRIMIPWLQGMMWYSCLTKEKRNRNKKPMTVPPSLDILYVGHLL